MTSVPSDSDGIRERPKELPYWFDMHGNIHEPCGIDWIDDFDWFVDQLLRKHANDKPERRPL